MPRQIPAAPAAGHDAEVPQCLESMDFTGVDLPDDTPARFPPLSPVVNPPLPRFPLPPVVLPPRLVVPGRCSGAARERSDCARGRKFLAASLANKARKDHGAALIHCRPHTWQAASAVECQARCQANAACEFFTRAPGTAG